MVAPRVYHGEYTLQETVILTQININMQARDLERITIHIDHDTPWAFPQIVPRARAQVVPAGLRPGVDHGRQGEPQLAPGLLPHAAGNGGEPRGHPGRQVLPVQRSYQCKCKDKEEHQPCI